MQAFRYDKTYPMMLGKIEGKMRRGQQRIRWLDSIINSMDMNLNKLQERAEDRRAWHGTVLRVSKSWTQLSDWTTATSTAAQRKAVAHLLLCILPTSGPWLSCFQPQFLNLLLSLCWTPPKMHIAPSFVSSRFLCTCQLTKAFSDHLLWNKCPTMVLLSFVLPCFSL